MSFGTLPLGCPPNDALGCVGVIYRLVPSLPIDASGFVCQFDLYPGKEWTDGCLARGLSVGRNYEDLGKLRKRIKAMKNFKIVIALLPAEVGVIKQTGKPEHHTWWPEDNVDLPSLFAVHPSETI